MQHLFSSSLNRHLGTPEWKHRSVGESHRAEDRRRCLPRTVQKDAILAEFRKTRLLGFELRKP